MSHQVRFIVRVDSEWKRAVTCDEDASWSWPAEPIEKLPDGSGGNFPKPCVALHSPDAAHESLGPAGGPDAIACLHDAIVLRTIQRHDIVTFGHYLFDALLGPKLWAAMRQKTESLGASDLELALSWADGDLDLHRLSWELMCSDAGFLVEKTDGLRVAITRLVESKQRVEVEPLDAPPRVLFIVGTSLTEDEIRPGAELHALLRQARGGRAMRYRVLERANPKRMKQEIAEFKPEIVHFICHGGVDEETGRVYLDLKTDEENADNRRFEHQLLSDLRSGETVPTIVVLSACMTAGGPGPRRVVLAGAHESAPLAASLVAGGIPIVLGMAGRVADITSRIFARRFGEAVITGQPLVMATADARQVAFAEGRDPLMSADWAFPAIFMHEDVPAGYKPVLREESDALWKTIEDWVSNYNLRRDPVFCGREEFLRLFHQLFETSTAGAETGGGRKRVLTAFVDTQMRGYGRTRLLQELAAQAFRDGHVPVLLTFEQTDPPKDLGALAQAFESAISQVRSLVLDLGEPLTSQLALIPGPPDTPGLDIAIAAEMRRSQGQHTHRAVSMAIRADLATLLADARARIPYFGEQAQVVVLLDDVDQYGSLIKFLFSQSDGILSGNGLGTPGQFVPVVMTCSLGGHQTESLRSLADGTKSIGWLRPVWLKPFEDNGEDVMAYQTVLLHPFAPSLLEEVSGKAWAFNDAIEEEKRREWEGRFRRSVKGIPINFHNDSFYLLCDWARSERFAIEADDEFWLGQLAGDQQ